MKSKPKVNIFWFRRDLRLDDNTGLFHALNSVYPVLPIFIFDTDILDLLDSKKDKRVQFIHNEVTRLHKELAKYGSSLLILHGSPLNVFKILVEKYDISEVFANHDYEPGANKRDCDIRNFLFTKQIPLITYKDQVIFEKDEITKSDGSLYTVYTPYKNAWKNILEDKPFIIRTNRNTRNFFKTPPFPLPSLNEIEFEITEIEIPPRSFKQLKLKDYEKNRDYPAKNYTSRLSIHLRFGTVSIRKLFSEAVNNEKFSNELIWREFFMMILANHPRVVSESFYPFGDRIKWRDNEEDFEKWKEGKTGYPMVDAGMRQLNKTGYMHNRARMVTASFLTKHLLIDWCWGETYFASKLLDYDLAANNGNWQWAAGTGCDAVPYFRVFNPELQQKRFDSKFEYIKTWVEEFGTDKYPKLMVDHDLARRRAIEVYRRAMQNNR